MTRVNRKRLRDLRISLGYSQEDLARAARISLRRMTDLENDSNTNPTIDTLSRIAQVLQCQVSDLLLEDR
jgi:transcriptional regulator with XRE-family HTH domain